jgi:ATP-dependent DNA helicase RecG
LEKPLAIEQLIKAPESETLEFKEAKSSLDKHTIAKYCAALANELGGFLVLGVTNQPPRSIVGTEAYSDEGKLQELKHYLVEQLHLRIEAHAYQTVQGRVLVFQVPSRPLGVPIPYQKTYWMHSGESLTYMTPDHLRRIFNETGPDFSEELNTKASLNDLDPASIERFRSLWMEKSKNPDLTALSHEQLLHDADLMVNGHITYASLILMGTAKAIGRFLPQAELIYEYRSNPDQIEYQARREYRQGILSYLDEVWKLIEARNEVQHLHVGLFVWQIATLNERVVREAILNAVCHRDYRLPGSVFVKHSPKTLEVISPGGFMPGITPENILEKQSPRNRRLAEAIYKCGFVERSGQGADLMFRFCLQESKAPPSFRGTDDYEVRLALDGHIQDESFLKYLEKVRQELGYQPTLNDLLIFHNVKQEQKIPDKLRPTLQNLIEKGLIERIGQGRGTKYILSKEYYSFIGEKGTYTRKIGLDRETNKKLLLQHIQSNAEDGCPLSELTQVLPHVSSRTLQRLLGELRDEGEIRMVGERKASRWLPPSAP